MGVLPFETVKNDHPVESVEYIIYNDIDGLEDTVTLYWLSIQT